MKKLLVFVLCSSLLLVSCQTYQANRLAEQGYEHMQSQNFDASSVLFAKASTKDAKNHTYRYNYLLSLFLQGHYDEVIVQSEEAFETFPFNLSFLLIQAQSYAEKQEYKQALVTYNRLFKLDPASYETQASVMEQALLWKEYETAKDLALGLVNQKAYEKKALGVLSEIAGDDTWYALALAYVTKEKQSQSQQ